MQSKYRRRILRYVKNSRYRSAWRKLVQVMACVVVFCTTYALILPAITMEKVPSCGIEAHTHNEDCWQQQSVMALNCAVDPAELPLHAHDSLCWDAQGTLVCSLTERTAHIHTDACYVRADMPACAYVHVHSEDCVGTEKLLTCPLEENEEHTHVEECYILQEKVCELTTNDGHIHTDDCFPLELACDQEELQAHVHEENCYSADGTLICTLPLLEQHQHNETCMAPTEQLENVLVCPLAEHVHEESCYPEVKETQYLCGMEAHIHDESCLSEEDGADGAEYICELEQHTHEAACLTAELDLTADVETAEQWESAFAELTLSGEWAEDLLTIARTQLDYQESEKNLILDEQTLKGYTRYGAKYGTPYADWSAMFVRFCLEYAGVKNYPVNSDAEQWAIALNVNHLLTDDGSALRPGDLIFLDMDGDTAADHVAIAEEQEPETGAWKCIVGDLKYDRVTNETIDLAADTVIGFSPLPEAPLQEAQIDQAAAVTALIAQLPEAETVRQTLRQYNIDLDKESFDAYLAQCQTQAAAAREAFSALTEDQGQLVMDISRLMELEALCGHTQWQEIRLLTSDDAAVISLCAESTEVTTVANQQTGVFAFSGETRTYSEVRYSEARMKLEVHLPVAEEQAVFDTAAMPWLEEAVVTTLADQETQAVTQVLTGYYRLTAADLETPAVPGAFTVKIAVKPLQMNHGDKLNVQLTAAMEHNLWDGICETHETAEALTVTSEALTIDAPASAEEQQAEYEALLAQYESILAQELPEEDLPAAGEALWTQISKAYLSGRLSEEAFDELSKKTLTLIYGDLNMLAEPGNPLLIQQLIDSGWVDEYSDYAGHYASNSNEPDVDLEELYSGFRSAGNYSLRSSSGDSPEDQVIDEGGDNVSDEGAVYVSKTIAQTETENVFDITLDVITKDIVTEVYQEPDMAVVIVMDISNTMTEYFDGTTTSRYSAAMTAAESFMKSFAANNKGASNLGFVAFNTHAYEVFPMQSCTSEAKAHELANTVRSTTSAKISEAKGNWLRFTNIEGGLKRAYDMLDGVDNKNKYIIFLSDGFPTTYLNTSTTGNLYDGLNTYDGTIFYDSVEKLSNGNPRPCSGTSYSDPAAIKARQMANSLKNEGAKIFSIGVDIGGQTIKQYVDLTKGWSTSIVDRRNTNYEIGSASSTSSFKNWLKNSIGSGEGYYYDSDNTTELNNAFTSIFETIKELNAASSHLDWVATDPMPGMGVHELKDIEFIGFYDKDGNLVSTDLQGTSAMGWEYENTAVFDEATQTIKWDLKQSRYLSQTAGDTTTHWCSLAYRVRLKNENTGFTEWSEYATNDETSLTYRIIDQKGTTVTVSEQRTVDFPIPSVRGYLAQLEFIKVDSLNAPLPYAEFALNHADTCTVCRGDAYYNTSTGATAAATAVPLPTYTAVSGDDGKVVFSNIPSGHDYVLTETKVPDGYLHNGNTYAVNVAYDTLTVTVTDQEGNPVAWDNASSENTVLNHTLFQLPETGGMGTHMYTFSGLAITMAALMYGYSLRRKRERGAAR